MHNKNKILLMIVALVLVALIAIVLLSRNSDGKIDSFDPEVTLYNSTKYVVLKDPDEKLTNELLPPNYKIVFSETLREYAERKHETYTEDSIIGFLIKDVRIEEDKNKVSGKFGESKEDEVFYITILNNNVIRFEYEINDTITFDESYEINKKKNQFIGSLPLEKDTYSVDYSAEDDTFLVTLNSSTYDLDTINSSIVAAAGVNSIEEINVTYLGRAGMPSPWW